MDRPALRFVSLFVADLEGARRRLETLLGVVAATPGAAPRSHPYAAGGPIELDVGGGVVLALYACDGRTTHPGDVALGLAGSAAAIAARAPAAGAHVVRHPGHDGLAVVMTADRHFLEIVSSGSCSEIESPGS